MTPFEELIFNEDSFVVAHVPTLQHLEKRLVPDRSRRLMVPPEVHGRQSTLDPDGSFRIARPVFQRAPSG
jgi:hypothetical protein